VRTVVVSLDPSIAAVSEAAARDAQLLVTHHPLLLNALERLDLSTTSGRVVAAAVRSGVSVYAAHTNLDRCEGGVNDALADRLELLEARPFGTGESQVKLAVSVPVGYEPQLRRAFADAGGGCLVGHARRTFASRGTARYLPIKSGPLPPEQVTAEESVEETRLEALVLQSRVEAVRRAVVAAHPCASPLVEVYPLSCRSSVGGLGRLGRLAAPRRLGEWARETAERLGAECARLVGDPALRIENVAVCGGAGAALWPEARAAGAQVLVTGDVKYHTALEAKAAGCCLLDVGHAASEKVAVELIHQVLGSWAQQTEATLLIHVFWELDPFSSLLP
jgi:dinuclear metal center YbgI/SA1388 family protein